MAGDQLPTDGILAYRLNFSFLHYMPRLTGVPLGPDLMHRWGELVRPVLFRRPASPPIATGPAMTAVPGYRAAGSRLVSRALTVPEPAWAAAGRAVHRGLGSYAEPRC